MLSCKRIDITHSFSLPKLDKVPVVRQEDYLFVIYCCAKGKPDTNIKNPGKKNKTYQIKPRAATMNHGPVVKSTLFISFKVCPGILKWYEP